VRGIAGMPGEGKREVLAALQQEEHGQQHEPNGKTNLNLKIERGSRAWMVALVATRSWEEACSIGGRETGVHWQRQQEQQQQQKQHEKKTKGPAQQPWKAAETRGLFFFFLLYIATQV